MLRAARSSNGRTDMYSWCFWKDAIERTVRTFAEATVALLTASGTGLLDTDFRQVLSIAGMAALIALMTSLTAGAVSPATGASLGTTSPK